MANIEIAKFENYDGYFRSLEQYNISGIVGPGGKNEPNDVMLIKALLFLNESNKDVSDLEYFGPSRVGLIDLPEINGILDTATIQAIWAFQRRNASLLLSIDGKIHPASYQNRIIKKSSGAKYMSITLLNQQAYYAPMYLDTHSLEQTIRKIAPAIRFT
jgi:hypothetical protein